MRNQDVVDAAQLGVDLEAKVGESLWGRLDYILHLHTLGGHAEERVADALHLSYTNHNNVIHRTCDSRMLRVTNFNPYHRPVSCQAG